MTKSFGKLVGAAALAATVVAGMAAPAAAQDVRGKRAGDMVVGLGAIGVLPDGKGKTDIGGVPHVSSAATAQLDFTYFLSPNFSLNLIAATTKHDVEVRDSALGTVNLGSVWALPPTLTAQYHLFPQSRFSPYVGLGVNATIFYGFSGKRTSPVTSVGIDNSFGVAFNAGIDYELSPNWLLNADVKRIMMRPDVSVNSGAVRGTANIDPWVVGISARYRF